MASPLPSPTCTSGEPRPTTPPRGWGWCGACCERVRVSRGRLVRHGTGQCRERFRKPIPDPLDAINRWLARQGREPLDPGLPSRRLEVWPVRVSYQDVIDATRSPLSASFVGWARSNVTPDLAKAETRSRGNRTLDETLWKLAHMPLPLVNEAVLILSLIHI